MTFNISQTKKFFKKILCGFSFFSNKEIKKIPLKNDDIILVSYPKSGSTWLRFLIANIIKKNTDLKNTNLDFNSCITIFPEIKKKNLDNPNPEELPSPRFLKSHTIYNPYFKNVIYILRDGRDAIVSYYFYHKKFFDLNCSFLDFLKQGHTKDWADHIITWLYQNRTNNLYLLKYEDLLDNTKEELENLLNYFKINYTEEELVKAIEYSSFQNMQKIEKEKGFIKEKGDGNKEINFVRKGQKNSWKEFFGEEEKRIFKKESGCLLNLLEYEKGTNW